MLAASVVVVALIGALALALPVTVFVIVKRARSFIRSSEIFVACAAKALASQVIAGVAASAPPTRR